MLLWISGPVICFKVGWLFESGKNGGYNYVVSEQVTLVLLLVVIPWKWQAMHVAMQRIGVGWSMVLLMVVTWKLWVVLIWPKSWCRLWNDMSAKDVQAMQSMSRSRRVNCIL